MIEVSIIVNMEVEDIEEAEAIAYDLHEILNDEGIINNTSVQYQEEN